MEASSLREIIWQIVASIPFGQVATYGQIAHLAGFPNHARYVGSTLKNLPKDTTLPWHRVINGKGEISFPLGSPGFEKQCSRLEEEGITIEGHRIKLKHFQWQRSTH